jgi:hypothetical protein
MRLYPRKNARPDAGYAPQVVHLTERTVLLTSRDNGLCQVFADTGKGAQIGCRCPIQIDFVTDGKELLAGDRV